MPMNLPVYADTQLLIEKESDMTWQKVNEAFSARSFKENLEDRQVYINVQKSGSTKFACRYLTFPCADIVSWRVSHTDPKNMTLNNGNGQMIFYFLALDYHRMYRLLELEPLMDSYFYSITNYLSTKNILKIWVKELAKFCQTPTKTYKTKSRRRAY